MEISSFQAAPSGVSSLNLWLSVSSVDAMAAEAENEAQNTESEPPCELHARPDAAPDVFMFPCALKTSDLAEEQLTHGLTTRTAVNPESSGSTDSSSEEDEDTDAPEDGVMSSIYKTKMFSDPEEYEKWKARGWRAVQCCGGALLVLGYQQEARDNERAQHKVVVPCWSFAAARRGSAAGYLPRPDGSPKRVRGSTVSWSGWTKHRACLGGTFLTELNP
eukprot:Skav200789  [mRNA]  locus=scaffold318:71808:79810:- [translate_table: standard]